MKPISEVIAREQNKKLSQVAEIFNPRLCDFSGDQLSLVLRSILTEQMAVRKHAESLQAYPSLTHMMRDKIHECEIEIEQLGEIVVQFAGAIARKRKERELESN